MLPLLILVSGLLLALYVGRFIFRRLRLKGRGKFLSGFIAVIVGPFVFFVYVGSLANVAMYFAGGEIISSYLREKNLIHHISRLEQTRIALELNLVNHIFPQ